jgi:hypothetical protein
MARLNVNDARCVALFVSELQRSDVPAREVPARGELAREEVAEVIRSTVRHFGIAGCASRMAQEFGDHPETAASRMRWIRQLIAELTPATPRTAAGATSAGTTGWPPVPAPGPRAAGPAVRSAQHAA